MTRAKSTIADVALHAGVSTATVSRVINKSPCSENTRLRVLRSIKELGYKVNTDGQALRSRKTNRILLSLANISNPFYTTLAETIENAISKSGYHILLSASANDEEEIQEQIEKAGSGFVDGFIFGPITFSPTTVDKLKKLTIPTVLIGPHIRGTKIDSVGTNEYHGMKEAILYLRTKGKKRFLLFNGPLDSIPGLNRNNCFLKIMSEINEKSVKFDVVNTSSFTFDQANIEIRKLVTIFNFDAIICGNDLMAAAVINYLREQNRAIPEETAVLGLDNDDFCSYVYPKISSIDINIPEQGEAAAKALLSRIQNPKQKYSEHLTVSRFIPRQST
jgi:LacI family transcriptional regulator